jgi:hypothetical protein
MSPMVQVFGLSGIFDLGPYCASTEVGESNTGLFRLAARLIPPKVLVSRSVPMGLLVLAYFNPQWPNLNFAVA